MTATLRNTLAFSLTIIALFAIVGTVAEAQQKRQDQINQEHTAHGHGPFNR